MKTRVCRLGSTFLAAGILFMLNGCSPASTVTDPGAQGTLRVRVLVPDYGRHEASKGIPRIVAPGTSRVRLLLDGTAFTTVSLGSGSAHPSQDFYIEATGDIFVPARTYSLVAVELLNGAGTVLTQGASADPVTVDVGGVTTAEIVTFPASSTALTAGTPQSGHVNQDGIVYYAFQGTVGETYEITVTSSVGTPDLFVFSPDGLPRYGVLERDPATLLGDYCYYNGGVPSVLRIAASSTGTYWVGVFGYQDASDYSIQYGTVATIPGDAFEPDDVAASATSIGIGSLSAQTHDLHTVGDEDWVRFSAESGRTYTIETHGTGTSTDTILYLYASDGAILLRSDDDSGVDNLSRIRWTAPGNGTFHAKVQGFDGMETGPYRIDIVLYDGSLGVDIR